MARQQIWSLALLFGAGVAWQLPAAARGAEEPAAAAVAAEYSFPPLLVVRTLGWETLATRPTATVRGVVIRQVPKSLVIQDETGGLYVNISLAIERGWLPEPLSPETAPVGHEVEIEGVLEPGGYAPIIVPRAIKLLGPKPLPEPRRKDPALLLTGGYDSELIEFTGIVQSVRKKTQYWVLVVNCRQREVLVGLARDVVDFDVTQLVDSEVRLRGVAATTFTPRGEFRSSVVYIDQPGWIDVVEPSPRRVLLAEKTRLRDAGRFRAKGDTGHLLRTGGTVVHAVAGEAVYLQDGAWGLRVETDSAEPVRPGDEVEVVGFLDRSLPVAGLVHASVSRVATGPPPTPVSITPADVLEVNRRAAEAFLPADPGDYHGCLVRFPARLVESRRGSEGGVLVLDVEGGTTLARMTDTVHAALAGLAPNSELDVTGILRLEWDPTRRAGVLGHPQAASLLVRSPADVVVTRLPSPWTPRRLGALLALATIGLSLVGGWAWWLKRRRELLETMVVERTAELAEARTQEKEAEERRRLLLEQRLKTSLTAAAVAHEINQPLSRLLLKCRLEADRGVGNSEFIDAVVADAERVVTTIEKMKVLLRNVETNHEPVDLGQVVTSALHQVKRLLPLHGITVRRAGPARGCIVRGDDVQLQFAVTNLLRNAAEAIVAANSARREIEVTIHDRGGDRSGEPAAAVELVVGDSGPGWPGGTIDEALLASTKPEGTGIGLFVVKTAVANHQGTVTVGRSPLGGAEFRLVLPRWQGGHEAAVAGGPAAL